MIEAGQDSGHGARIGAFWSSTISFFLALVGWFALAPITIDVAYSIFICESQVSAQ